VTAHLLDRLGHVRQSLGGDITDTGAETPLAEVLDSMGLVELVAILADDWQTTPAAIERCVGQRFGTVAELAQALCAAGLPFRALAGSVSVMPRSQHVKPVPLGWLGPVAVRLPSTVQS